MVWHGTLAFITTNGWVKLALSCKLRQVNALIYSSVISFYSLRLREWRHSTYRAYFLPGLPEHAGRYSG